MKVVKVYKEVRKNLIQYQGRKIILRGSDYALAFVAFLFICETIYFLKGGF